MIYLPIKLVTGARRLGLNISKISHNALADTITKLNSPNGELDSVREEEEGSSVDMTQVFRRISIVSAFDTSCHWSRE
jgi:prenyltransferase beta subunit